MAATLRGGAALAWRLRLPRGQPAAATCGCRSGHHRREPSHHGRYDHLV